MALNKVLNSLPCGAKKINPSQYAQGLLRTGSVSGPVTLGSLQNQTKVGIFLDPCRSEAVDSGCPAARSNGHLSAIRPASPSLERLTQP